MGDEQIWPTRRALVYKGADPRRPKWKSRAKSPRSRLRQRQECHEEIRPVRILSEMHNWPAANGKSIRMLSPARSPFSERAVFAQLESGKGLQMSFTRRQIRFVAVL